MVVEMYVHKINLKVFGFGYIKRGVYQVFGYISRSW